MEEIHIWLLAILLINVSFSNSVNVTLYNPNSTVIYNPTVECDGKRYFLPNLEEGESYSVYLLPEKSFTLKVVYEWIECNETYCPVLPNRISTWKKHYTWSGIGYIDVERLKNRNIKKKAELIELEGKKEILKTELKTLNEYKRNLKKYYEKLAYLERMIRYASIGLAGVFVCLILYTATRFIF
ncbi:MAG: hypothetical protein ACE5K4_05460 [Candidatus Hydrothermarchaeota archaeon]